MMMMASITLIAGEYLSVGLALTAAKRHKLDKIIRRGFRFPVLYEDELDW